VWDSFIFPLYDRWSCGGSCAASARFRPCHRVLGNPRVLGNLERQVPCACECSAGVSVSRDSRIASGPLRRPPTEGAGAVSGLRKPGCWAPLAPQRRLSPHSHQRPRAPPLALRRPSGSNHSLVANCVTLKCSPIYSALVVFVRSPQQ
jgi:hypothetical protein